MTNSPTCPTCGGSGIISRVGGPVFESCPDPSHGTGLAAPSERIRHILEKREGGEEWICKCGYITASEAEAEEHYMNPPSEPTHEETDGVDDSLGPDIPVSEPADSASDRTSVELFENAFREALADIGITDGQAYDIIIRTIEPRMALVERERQSGRVEELEHHISNLVYATAYVPSNEYLQSELKLARARLTQLTNPTKDTNQ
jgi:hypothetical protein